MNSRILLGLVLVLAACGTRLFLGPVYICDDGCACGRRRQWYSFDECAPLRQKQFLLIVFSEGDPKHQHQYYDATWSEQFWLFPSHADRAIDSTQKTFDPLCGRWQSVSGDTYDFSDDGTYERWRQPEGNNYRAQALNPEPVPGGVIEGRFSVVSGNLLILAQKAGASVTNRFSIENDGAFNTNHPGKCFQSGYALKIVSAEGSISRYELMFK